MTDFNKLADALENIAHMEYPSAHHDGNNLREAVSILRAAGAADVAGLMAMHDDAAEARHINGAPAYNSKSSEARAALESALRMALAPKAGADAVLRELVDANREPFWFHLNDSRPRPGQSYECWQAEREEDRKHRIRRAARLEAAWVRAYDHVFAASKSVAAQEPPK